MTISLEDLKSELNAQSSRLDAISRSVSELNNSYLGNKEVASNLATTRLLDVSNQIAKLSLEIAVLTEKLLNSNRDFNNIKLDLEHDIKNFVTKEEFKPIKGIIYTLLGTIALAVLWTILTKILNLNHPPI
jgi:chromosome segregation ATPase